MAIFSSQIASVTCLLTAVLFYHTAVPHVIELMDLSRASRFSL